MYILLNNSNIAYFWHNVFNKLKLLFWRVAVNTFKVLCVYIRGVTISQTKPKDRDTPPTIRIAVLSRPLLPIVEVNGTYL